MATKEKPPPVDPTIAKDESGHPIRHAFSRAIPTAQCMSCHMHQPNMFLNSYLGYTMWDYESDAPNMWPEEQKYPTSAEIREVNERNSTAPPPAVSGRIRNSSRPFPRAEPPQQEHPQRGLPRPRMELPRHLPKGSEGICWTEREYRLPR